MTDLPRRAPDLDPLAGWIQELNQTPGRLESEPELTPFDAMPTASVPYGAVVHPDAPIPIRLHFRGEGAVDRIRRLTSVWEQNQRAGAEANAEAAPIQSTQLHAGSLVAERTVETDPGDEKSDDQGSLFEVFVRFLAAASTQSQRNEIFQSLLTDLQKAGLVAEANAAAPEEDDPGVLLLEDILAGLRKL